MRAERVRACDRCDGAAVWSRDRHGWVCRSCGIIWRDDDVCQEVLVAK